MKSNSNKVVCIMEKKFKADNGFDNFYWTIAALILLALVVYKYVESSNTWSYILPISIYTLFVLSVTVKEYVITELNFLEIRFVIKLFAKKRRIAIGDIIGLKKVKNNQLRIDLVRGFEVLRVKESDIDSLIAELIDRNPRIKMPE